MAVSLALRGLLRALLWLATVPATAWACLKHYPYKHLFPLFDQAYMQLLVAALHAAGPHQVRKHHLVSIQQNSSPLHETGIMIYCTFMQPLQSVDHIWFNPQVQSCLQPDFFGHRTAVCVLGIYCQLQHSNLIWCQNHSFIRTRVSRGFLVHETTGLSVGLRCGAIGKLSVVVWCFCRYGTAGLTQTQITNNAPFTIRVDRTTGRLSCKWQKGLFAHTRHTCRKHVGRCCSQIYKHCTVSTESQLSCMLHVELSLMVVMPLLAA